jgi:hypothetical protein
MHSDSAPVDSAAKTAAGKRRPRGPALGTAQGQPAERTARRGAGDLRRAWLCGCATRGRGNEGGVSKGTLYLYYDNKEELFKAVVRRSIAPLIAETREMIERSDKDSEALLAQFLQTWWTRYGGTRLAGITKLVIGEAGNFPRDGPILQR